MVIMFQEWAAARFAMSHGIRYGTADMDAAEKVKALIEPVVEDMGYELVRVTFGGGQRPTLQIMAERPDGTMNVEDCAELSRELSALLDVEDPIPSDYILEVSSPGIDRPLTREKDFTRWSGHLLRVETSAPVDGRRRFKGRLLGLDSGMVRIRQDEGDVALPLADIQKARLVMTDELIAEAGRQAGGAQD